VGDERTVLWKEETLIDISAINTLGRKEKEHPKPQTHTRFALVLSGWQPRSS